MPRDLYHRRARVTELESSLANLSTSMVINGQTVTSDFFLLGQDATLTNWASLASGPTFALGAGTNPSLDEPTPTLASSDAAIKNASGGAGWVASTSAGEILTKDAVIEAVYRYDDISLVNKNLCNTRSGTGWVLRVATNELQLYMTGASGSHATATTGNFVVDHQWNHLLIFIDYSGKAAIYINGHHENTSAADVGSSTGSISNGVNPTVAVSFPGCVAQLAMWTKADWLDTHLQGDVALARTKLLRGTNGSDTRDSAAYLHRPISGALKYFQVGSNWQRLSRGLTGAAAYQSEAAATTRIKDSLDVSASNWVQTRCSVAATAVVTPDLVSRTANMLHEDATAGAVTHHNRIPFSCTADKQYTLSFFGKADNRRYVLPWVNGTGVDSEPVFDLQGGTVTMDDVAGTDATSITDVGDGWFFCTSTVTVPVGTTSLTAYFMIEAVSDAAYNSGFQGLDQDSLAIWGVQFEEGTEATSLIASVNAYTTRLADA